MPTTDHSRTFPLSGRKCEFFLRLPSCWKGADGKRSGGADQHLNPRLTNFNVAISVVSLFILLAKMILFIMKVWYPLIGVCFNTGLVAIFAVSVYGQMGPDYADARYPSPIAWYIAKGCSYARAEKAERSCMLAKGSFAVTVFML